MVPDCRAISGFRLFRANSATPNTQSMYNDHYSSRAQCMCLYDDCMTRNECLSPAVTRCGMYGTSTPQMSTKQAKIEKMKLEIRKLEAERDGLKQVRKLDGC